MGYDYRNYHTFRIKVEDAPIIAARAYQAKFEFNSNYTYRQRSRYIEILARPVIPLRKALYSKCRLGTFVGKLRDRIFPDFQSKKKKREMILRYYLDESGRRVYTLSAQDGNDNPTFTAHPARFSPDDKYVTQFLSPELISRFSSQRVALKRRFGLLPAHKGVEKA